MNSQQWEQLLDRGEKQAELRLRELRLPPELRSSKPACRDLRDALLGVYKLGSPTDVPDMRGLSGEEVLEHIRVRSNSRTELHGIIKQLESTLTSEEVSWAREAARTLHTWHLRRNHASPGARKHRGGG